MIANVGDRLIIKGHVVGDHDRDAEILEVRGAGGTPPYVVRWEDTGHETLFFPGTDAVIQHLGTVEATVEATATSIGEEIRTEHHHLLMGVHRLLDAADALDTAADAVPDAVHEAHAFLTGELLPHARAEEDTIYRTVGELLGDARAADPMRRQHVEVDRLVERLGRLRALAMVGLDEPTRRNLRQVLHALHAILTLHLATEEELYVPLLEATLSPRRSEQLAAAMHEAEASTALATT